MTFFGYDKRELMGIGIRPWVIKFQTKDDKWSIKNINLKFRHNLKQTLCLDECSFTNIFQTSNVFGWIIWKQSLLTSLLAILTPLTTNVFGKVC